jgi:ABC-2 type transport system ATP-binding protein
VVVVNQGRALFAGTPAELAAQAEGRVWVNSTRDPGALAAWRLGEGRFHHVGTPPAGAQLVDPTIEDAYLLMLGPQAPGERDVA